MTGHGELTGIAIVGLAALICGMVMMRLRQPPVVGYILAGLLLGPTAVGVVSDASEIRLLADIGVLMLLFMIGLELPVAAFVRVWRTALMVVAGQILVFLAITFALSSVMAWPPGFAALLAFAAALSSTAVAIKMVEDIGEGNTDIGRASVAILIAQDLAVVPMMLIVRDIGGGGISTTSLAKVLASGILLTLLLIYFGRRGRFRLAIAERIANHRELRPVAVFALCLAAATAAGLIGVSAAYGAFLAGLILGNAEGVEGLKEAARPIEGLLIMAFFLSVGLLIDIGYLWTHLDEVLTWLAVVTLVKTALNIALLRLLRQPWRKAFLTGVILGQIGEFSFLLAAVAGDVGIIPEGQHQLIVAVVALSLLISPLWLLTARRLHAVAARRRTTLGAMLNYLYGREARWCRERVIAIFSRRRNAAEAVGADTGEVPAAAGAAAVPAAEEPARAGERRERPAETMETEAAEPAPGADGRA